MTHGKQRPKERRGRAIRQHKRVPLEGERCETTRKMCWTRDTARQQARYARKRDEDAAVGWYRCTHCGWFHLGHG